MKRIDLFDEMLPANFQEGAEIAIVFLRKHPLSVCLFLLMCLNGAIAPAVCAASGDTITRTAAWAIGLLGIVTLGLSIYLFAVIFQPERF